MVSRRMSARQILALVRNLARQKELTLVELRSRGKDSHRLYRLVDVGGSEVVRFGVTNHPGDISWLVFRRLAASWRQNAVIRARLTAFWRQNAVIVFGDGDEPAGSTSTSASGSTSCACAGMIGFWDDGRKQLVALTNGCRESTEPLGGITAKIVPS